MITFSNIITNLSNNIPETILKDISIPFCFICLLHLANEKEFEILQEKGSLGELLINSC